MRDRLLGFNTKKKTFRIASAKKTKNRNNTTRTHHFIFYFGMLRGLFVHLLSLDDALLLLLGAEVKSDKEGAWDEHADDDSKGCRSVVRQELGGQLR